MHVEIGSATSEISGDDKALLSIHEHFSFTDKSAEGAFQRLKKNMMFKERSLISQEGGLPDWYPKWKDTKIQEARASIHVYICELSVKSLICPTGLVPHVVEFLKLKNIPFTCKDIRDFDCSKRMLSGQKPPGLRAPQQLALQAILAERPAHERGLGLVELPTGVGKTLLAQVLIQTLGVRSIFLVPSSIILNQTAERFEAAFGKKNVAIYGDGKKQVGYVTIATYQSVHMAPEGTFDAVQMMIADECHHTPADTFFNAAQNKLKNCVYRYGLSASPERTDGATMQIHAGVGPTIFQYSVKDAIADKFLASPTFIIYDVWETHGRYNKYQEKDGKRTLTGVENSKQYNGDDKLTCYRNWVLGNDLLTDHVVGLTESFVADGKSVLVLVDQIEHGEKLLARIPDAGFAKGGGLDNDDLQKAFNKRKLKVLIGTSTLGEGADTIAVDVLINLQGGASRPKTIQVNGRALRNDPDPDTGIPRKPTTLIIDFDFPLCDMFHRHAQTRQTVHKTMGEIHKSKM